MNIYVIVGANLLILAALVIGFFAGKKNGFNLQLPKTLILLAIIAGAAFATPELVAIISKIEGTEVATQYTNLFPAAVFCGIVGVLYVIASAIFAIIKANSTKYLKPGKGSSKSIIKITDKKLLKEQAKKEASFYKQAKKQKIAEYRKAHKVLGITGGIHGVICAILIMAVLFIPGKRVFNFFNLMEEYEYTAIGVIDKETDFVEELMKIIKSEEIIEEDPIDDEDPTDIEDPIDNEDPIDTEDPVEDEDPNEEQGD